MKDMSKEEIISYIVRHLYEADKNTLRNIYHFVLHIV